jgi:hypothetical protein
MAPPVNNKIVCPLCHVDWYETDGVKRKVCPGCGATNAEMFRACLPIIRRLQEVAKSAANVVKPEPVKKGPTKAEIEGERLFPVAFALYPRTKGVSRVAALKAWMARIREGVDPDAMIEGTKAYAAYVKNLGTEQEHIKLPSTFYGPSHHYASDWGGEAEAAPVTSAAQKPRGSFTPESRAREELERTYASERWTA